MGRLCFYHPLSQPILVLVAQHFLNLGAGFTVPWFLSNLGTRCDIHCTGSTEIPVPVVQYLLYYGGKILLYYWKYAKLRLLGSLM